MLFSALDDTIMQITVKFEEVELTEQTLIIFAIDNVGATYAGATDNGVLGEGKFSTVRRQNQYSYDHVTLVKSSGRN